jgi:hypothetical protein
MKRIAIAACLVVGCGNDAKTKPGAGSGSASVVKEGAFPAEVTALEKKSGRPFPGVVVAPSGLFLDHQPMSSPEMLVEELAAKKESPADRSVAMVVVTGGDGEVVAKAIRAVAKAGYEKLSIQRVADPPQKVCDLAWQPLVDPEEMVLMSILLTKAETVVGLSRIAEFQVIEHHAGTPDLDKLKLTLDDHKKTPFFIERSDAQIAVDPGVPATAFLGALGVTCARFSNLAVVSPDELAARPGLTPPPPRDIAPTPGTVEQPGATGDFKGLTNEDVDRVVKSRAGVIKACYARQLDRKPTLAGKLVIGIEIGANGLVVAARVDKTSTLDDREVADCVKRQIERMKFPAKGGATVKYPFIFSPP